MKRIFLIVTVILLLAGLNSCCCMSDRQQMLYSISVGNYYAKSGDFKEAIKYYDKAIEIAPTDPIAYHEKAKTLKAQGNNKLAKNYYTATLEIFKKMHDGPSDSIIFNKDVADVCENLDMYKEAIEFHEMNQKLNAENPDLIKKKIAELKAKIKDNNDKSDSEK